MDKNNGPLMFIDTVQSKDQKNGKKVFDSRERKEIKKISDEEILIFSNMASLYKKNMPVVCSITCNNNIFEGTILDIDNDFLYILDNGIKKEISLNTIQSYLILDF